MRHKSLAGLQESRETKAAVGERNGEQGGNKSKNRKIGLSPDFLIAKFRHTLKSSGSPPLFVFKPATQLGSCLLPHPHLIMNCLLP